MVDESTEDLLRNARSGDRVAFGRLADRFSDRLRNLVKSRLGPALREDLDVDDVVQDTFRRALEGIEGFESTGEDSFIRWLGVIAENVIRKAARVKRRYPTHGRDLRGRRTIHVSEREPPTRGEVRATSEGP